MSWYPIVELGRKSSISRVSKNSMLKRKKKLRHLANWAFSSVFPRRFPLAMLYVVVGSKNICSICAVPERKIDYT
jgi:hypothetical protein